MTFLLRDTVIATKPISSLARYLSRNPEAYLQLLLDLSGKKTFGRIIKCPTYPVRIITSDLERNKQLLCQSVSSDPHGISHALAFLYNAATEKNKRKRQGQFFTPEYVARKAISLLGLKTGDSLLDPGCGTGVFAIAMHEELVRRSKNIADFGYLGIENDPLLVLAASLSLDWINAPDNWRLFYGNYLNVKSADIEEATGDEKSIRAIISNPPYVRYHFLGEKSQLAAELKLHGFSGLHSYFLAHSSKTLPGRKMVFIVPLEMNGTKYWAFQMKQLKNEFNLGNELICYDERNKVWKSQGAKNLPLDLYTGAQHVWNVMFFAPLPRKETKSQLRIAVPRSRENTVQLGSFASVHRGISTGCNFFFVITDESARNMALSEEEGYIKRIIPTKIPKARLGEIFDERDWNSLKEEGRPCWLLSLPKERPREELPHKLRLYLGRGESLGVHLIPTCRIRKQWWYCIKIPSIPHLFFTYVSQGPPVFVCNKAHVHNLTNLLGVFLKTPAKLSEDRSRKLVRFLNQELLMWTERESVGRRYQGGLVKLEPKELEKMPVSVSALSEMGICYTPLSLDRA